MKITRIIFFKSEYYVFYHTQANDQQKILIEILTLESKNMIKIKKGELNIYEFCDNEIRINNPI
jgi:hypothetical protein